MGKFYIERNGELIPIEGIGEDMPEIRPAPRKVVNFSDYLARKRLLYPEPIEFEIDDPHGFVFKSLLNSLFD